MIRLARGLALPVDLCTQTLAIFGKRGSGKTNTAVVLAEQLYQARVPFVVIDPVDVWWGLKASRDGKSRGLDVYVFGGQHADLPLESTAGDLLADVVIDHRISVVLSVKHFTGGEKSRFVEAFAKRLLRRNTEPLHVFLEEAHELAPQDVRKSEAAPGMVGAIHRLWKLGRSSGIGGSAITQRPASLNKNVTTQAEVLVVHRTIGPQDRNAIKAWIEYHGEREEILAHLADLKTGEAYVWAPDFPEDAPVGVKRVKIHQRTTYDSSRTPKVGERRREPKRLAAPDLEALRERMAATIERAEAEDPKALRRRIQELEAAARKGQPASAQQLEAARLEGAREAEGRMTRLIGQVERRSRTVAGVLDDLRSRAGEAAAHLQAVEIASEKALEVLRSPIDVELAQRVEKRPTRRPEAIPARQPAGDPDQSLPRGERAVLTVCAQYPGGATRDQITVLTGYKRSSRDAYLQRLRERGLLEQADARTHVPTSEGIAALGADFEPLPTGQALVDYWLARLPRGEAACLRTILAAWPDAISISEISEATGYKRSSRDAYLQRLRFRQLVERASRGTFRAAAELGL